MLGAVGGGVAVSRPDEEALAAWCDRQREEADDWEIDAQGEGDDATGDDEVAS